MLIAGQEQLVPHSMVRRNQIITRGRHPVHHLVILRNVGIKYAECADYLAAGIRQKWILNIVSRAEGFENLARVISNRRRINAVRLEFSERELQLDELVAAVGSPIGAAAEDQEQPIWSHQVVRSPPFPMLIGQRKVGDFLADFRTGAITVISFPPAANLRIMS
jgi:hypothetical protein